MLIMKKSEYTKKITKMIGRDEVISDGCCLGEGNLCIDSMKIQTD